MAFERLSDKLQNVFKKLRGKGVLTEKDIKDALREVKLALLEADVNFKVVKDFVKMVQERAAGQEVMGSLTPGQQVIKIVHEEMITLLGGAENTTIRYDSKPPTVIMLLGLQGAGKTTMAAKLAGYLKKQGKKPILVACDVYRPAAVKQLQIVGAQVDVPVFEMGTNVSPVEIAKNGVAQAVKNDCGVVILDTAGRLHIDEQLMDELKQIREETQPTELLLVVDAMTGQDAVNVSKQFDEALDITGVILTKLDGDTRGGAAISIRAVTGKPIKFAGVGEKVTDIEPFYPDRMASRILGMGDVLTLIDKAQAAFDEKQAAELEEKMRKNKFTLTDYLEQMKQIKQMGPLENLIGMIPGAGKALKGATVDEKAMAHFEAIILSMTPGEREDPSVINASRRRRIAAGSGRTVEEVNRLLRQFEQMNKLFKQLNSKKKNKNFLRGFGI